MMAKSRIAVACDHAGYELKLELLKELEKLGYEYKDFGTNSTESCDYPLFAQRVSQEILNNNFELGLLVCGTGQGMAIMANRNKGIRAVVCGDLFTAEATRTHNNANVLCLGARVTNTDLAKQILNIWLKSEFLGGRHQRRVDMFDE